MSIDQVALIVLQQYSNHIEPNNRNCNDRNESPPPAGGGGCE